MTTLQEFLAGEPLAYRRALPPDGKKKKKRTRWQEMTATYRAGVGVYVETASGEELGCADVTDDTGATRVYHNLTRGLTDAETSDSRED